MSTDQSSEISKLSRVQKRQEERAKKREAQIANYKAKNIHFQAYGTVNVDLFPVVKEETKENA